MERRSFVVLSEYRARALGLLSPEGELDPDAEPAIPPEGDGVRAFDDEEGPGAPLPLAEAAEIAWEAGWLRAVAVQTGGDQAEVGEAWLVRALPEGGARPEDALPEPRAESEVEAAAAAWRADGRARDAAAAEIRRRRLEAMGAETRAESAALAGGSALALAGAL